MRKAISLALMALVLSSTAWAADNITLEKQIQELIQQNKLLQERIVNLEKIVGTVGVGEICKITGKAVQPEKDLAQQPSGAAVDSITERLRQVERVIEKSKTDILKDEVESPLGPGKCRAQLGGLIELEAFSRDDFDKSETSDISLSTVQFSLDAYPTDWSHGRLVFLYEEGEGDDHVLVDEGTVTLGNMDTFPATVTVGKKYLPFGSYLTSTISDPLTLDLGETSDSVLQADIQFLGFYGSAYLFNGDISERGEDDKIDAYGAALGLANVIEDFSYDIGVEWISNIGDSDGIGDHLSDTVNGEVEDYVDGFSAHLLMAYGPVNFFAEYVGARQSFKTSELEFRGRGAKPEAWGLEMGYNITLLNREALFSVGYHRTEESLALGLPEERYLVAMSLGIFDNTTLSFEWAHDEDYDDGDFSATCLDDDGAIINCTGSDSDAETVTMQIAVEF
ncbi:MAG: LbtU family siderophore porin [Desulfobulbaceae bacterium]|uniref:LbtU family siderophore porin n=1 Tax=Candidatus Desulfobia pelagia TaxID=2841692 RepID=A0A8J6TFN2_9BACT|nr:LbtU family siderophore porin [Candidatus Desulfobia pelagia]